MSGGTAAISIATTVISTAVGMYAQAQAQAAQEKSQKAAAEYNAQMAENQKAQHLQEAQNKAAKGAADIERQQRQAARAMGQKRADMAASGFEMDSGSSLSLLAEDAAEHQYDTAVLASNTEQDIWQSQVAAINATNQKSLADWQYANAGSGRAATGIAMAGTLLGGIGEGIGTYNTWQQNKKPASTGTDTPWYRSL